MVWHTEGATIQNPTIQQDATDMLKAVTALPGVEAVVNQDTQAGAPRLSESAETAYAMVLVDERAMIASACRRRPGPHMFRQVRGRNRRPVD
jgi:hypothetical protein